MKTPWRERIGARWRPAAAALLFLAVAWAPAAAKAEESPPASQPGRAAESSPRFFKVCKNQTYALCAVASCIAYNGVAYCKCDVKSGDSISLPFNFDSEDVCSVNAKGADDGYMVSTFSLPDSVRAGGDQALYTCPAGSDGAYAQCDGGICFTSSEGQSFPGFSQPLDKHQIMCACPITLPQASAKVGYQIAGPYPCEDSFFENCRRASANKKTGSMFQVGAPTGTPRFLTRRLYGSVPKLNECRAPNGK